MSWCVAYRFWGLILAKVMGAGGVGPGAGDACASHQRRNQLTSTVRTLIPSHVVRLQAGQTLRRVDAVLTALDAAAAAAVEGAADSGLPDGLAAQLEQAARSLREQREAGQSGLPANPSLSRNAELLRRLLPRTAELAALMQQYYALPALDEPRQLALAQAAAGRCCAYLRCANVGGEGGSAASEGVGSKCCRCVHCG